MSLFLMLTAFGDHVIYIESFDDTPANGSLGLRILTSGSFVISRTKTPRHEEHELCHQQESKHRHRNSLDTF